MASMSEILKGLVGRNVEVSYGDGVVTMGITAANRGSLVVEIGDDYVYITHGEMESWINLSHISKIVKY